MAGLPLFVLMIRSRTFFVVRLTIGAMNSGPMSRPLKQLTHREALASQHSIA
jgi:hypothetical protein